MWKPLHQPEQPAHQIKGSLESVLKRLGGASMEAQSGIAGAWEGAVGDDVAAHAWPLGLVDGVLTVEVDDVRWVTQLKWLGGRISDRLNDALGDNYVERLNVRLSSSKGQK